MLLHESHRLQGELTALDAKERATVEAQIAGLQAGASPAAYAGMFQSIAADRIRINERLNTLQAKRPASCDQYQTEAEKVAFILGEVETALQDLDLTVVEKRALIGRIILAIHPEEDGYRLTLRESGETVDNITMSPARDDPKARDTRVELWRERRAPSANWVIGDPRGWEQTHGQTAELTPLGRKLLGMESWEQEK